MLTQDRQEILKIGGEVCPVGPHDADDETFVHRRAVNCKTRRVRTSVALGLHQVHEIRPDIAGAAQNPSCYAAHGLTSSVFVYCIQNA